IKKMFLINILKVFFAALLIIFLIVIMHFTAGLDVFTEIFAIFGIIIEPLVAVVWFVIAVFVITIILLLINYLSFLNIRYEFYDNHLTIYKSMLLIFTNSKEIHYKNISKVTFDKKGFLNELLDTGTIYLDLSSMGEDNLSLEFMDEVSQTAEFIQSAIRAYLARTQAEYTEKYRINDLLDKGGL
ncbi:MAG: hypothetical protein KKH40_07585, partial [Nanoarchaeota archaeon]|nr:hypothetical protein [Nanoarchaeota archaeon]